MRKLKLQVDELVVDSFEAVDSNRKAEGTVRGYEDQLPYSHQYNISCQRGCTQNCSGASACETYDGPTCNSPDCIDYQ
jgi:hypothetical protein